MKKQEATSLIKNQEYDKAKILICSLLEENENDIELLKLLGLCNINLNCYDEAYENFSTLVKLDNEDALSLYYLATIQIERLDFDKAEPLLQKVIELRENYLDAYKSLAIVYLKQKQLKNIFNLEPKLIQLGTDDIQIYDILSTAAYEMGKPDLSAEYVSKGLILEPENSKFHNKYGLALFAMGKIQEAINEFKQALSIHNNVPSVLYNLGLAYFAKEEYTNSYKALKESYEIEKREQTLSSLALSALKAKENKAAIEYYKLLISIHPDRENYKYNLACAYDGNKEGEKAAEIIEKLLTFNLNSSQLKLHLASLYSRYNKFEAAKILYSDLIKTGIMNENILYEYAVLCAKTKETDKAEEIFKKVINNNPEYVLAYKDLAIIYLSRKFFDRALENFQKAYKIEPDNIFVLFEYANYFHLMSDFEQAKKLYTKLLKNEEIPTYMLVSTAINYISMNLINKAKETLLRAIKIEPQNIEVLFHLAQVYFSEKNYTTSKQLLEDAYNIAPNTEIANLLAKVCLETGDYNQAYALYNLVNLAIPNNLSILMGMATCKYKQNLFEEAKEHLNAILKILPEHEEAVELLNKIEKEEQQ